MASSNSRREQNGNRLVRKRSSRAPFCAAETRHSSRCRPGPLPPAQCADEERGFPLLMAMNCISNETGATRLDGQKPPFMLFGDSAASLI